MCMWDSILSGVIIRISRAARILGGGGWPTRKFIGATGINPVTSNNNIKHLTTLGHYWVTNAVDLDNKNKKETWGMPRARDPCLRLWYIYNYPYLACPRILRLRSIILLSLLLNAVAAASLSNCM